MSNVLDEWFGPAPLHEDLVREVLTGGLDVSIHPYRDKHKVMVRKRGQLVSRPVMHYTAKEVMSAYEEGKLLRLLPRRGKNSAELRILMRPIQ